MCVFRSCDWDGGHAATASALEGRLAGCRLGRAGRVLASPWVYSVGRQKPKKKAGRAADACGLAKERAGWTTLLWDRRQPGNTLTASSPTRRCVTLIISFFPLPPPLFAPPFFPTPKASHWRGRARAILPDRPGLVVLCMEIGNG